MKKQFTLKFFVSLVAMSLAFANTSCSLYHKVFSSNEKTQNIPSKKVDVKKTSTTSVKVTKEKSKAKQVAVPVKTQVVSKNVSAKAVPKKVNNKKIALSLNSVFTNNMVLQQDAPITFFGKVTPKGKVEVSFAGKTVKVDAQANGNWEAKFPSMKGGFTPYTVTVSSHGTTITLNNILIGEVWFCSGQSNMQMPVGAKFKRGSTAKNCETEVAKSDYPYIRYVSQVLKHSHQNVLDADLRDKSWVVTSPLTTAKYSATAYFFGRELFKNLNVPIGLINSSWGGTRIEPWIPQDSFKGIAHDEKIVKKYNLPKAELDKLLAADWQRYVNEYNAFEKAYAAYEKSLTPSNELSDFTKINFSTKNWTAAPGKLAYGKAGTKLFRAVFLLPKRMVNDKNITIYVPEIAPAATVYLNGKIIGSWTGNLPQGKRNLTVSLPQSSFNKGANVLAIKADYYNLDNASRVLMTRLSSVRLNNGTAMINRLGFRTTISKIVNYKNLKVKTPTPFGLPFQRHQFQGALYNSMVAAWTKLPIRGVIWYQGCSNSGQMHYYVLHKRLIEAWRNKWNNPQMPFIIVQLAGYEPGAVNTWRQSDPTKAHRFALTRDIQMEMLKIKNVGLACAIDIGEVNNIHPANKQDVGLRLALEAQRIAYGKNIVSQGPLYKSTAIEGNKIRVFFNNAQSGLKTSDNKSPNGFAIAGADGKFVWANAVIEKDTVVVSSPKVVSPKYVRYAYVGYRGDCNLQNKEGLPAYPFTSLANQYSDAK